MDATEERTLLEQLLDKRKTLLDEIGTQIEGRETERTQMEQRAADKDESKRPTAEERTAFTEAEATFAADFAAREQEIKDLTRRIDQQELQELRRTEASRASRPSISVTREPMTYRSDNAEEFSYFKDLACSQLPNVAASMRSTGPDEARERLQRHGKEIDVEMPKRLEARERRARKQVDEAEKDFTGSFVDGPGRRGLAATPFERRVNPNRTQGQGGYFVPPLWLIDEFIPLLRAGRVAAGLARNLDLPPGTDSINIPKLASGTATAVQTADNAAVQSTDLTDTSVQANVKTVAGQQDVAIQLLDQSPGQIIDQVVMEDLMADYNRLVDRQVIWGNGTNTATLNGGQVLGLYPATNWAGTNIITYTATTPNPQHFVQVMGAMASQASYSRFDLNDFHFLLHPRRWFWYATGLDSTGRPLVESPRGMGLNMSSTEVAELPAQGYAGNVPFGPNVYIDGNVPLTDTTGGGTGQDVGIAAKWDDVWLFEGDMRTRVLEEVLSGTLEVRFQAYNYIAMLVRYGQSISLAEGSGFAAPVGAVAGLLY
jgi:HK97 family phage major capsid protein